MSPGSTVLFGALPEQLKFSRTEKRRLATFARDLSVKIARGRGFNCLIADDAELRRLNLAFRGHDYATDVLSFPAYAANFDSATDSLGEIAISVERAERQARLLGHALMDELRVLMLHGLLHLSGMNHEADEGEMARAELDWRARFGLPETLIARTVTEAVNA
jgi:probable rRNA maturation factor